MKPVTLRTHPEPDSVSKSKPRAIRRHCKIVRLPADLRERLNLTLSCT